MLIHSKTLANLINYHYIYISLLTPNNMNRQDFINHYTEYLSKKQKNKFIRRLEMVINDELLKYRERIGFYNELISLLDQNEDLNNKHTHSPDPDKQPTLSEVLNKETPNNP